MPRIKPSEPKDPAAAKRQAKATARLAEAGGKRMTLKLQAPHVKKVQKLVKAGYAADQQAVLLRLIEDA